MTKNDDLFDIRYVVFDPEEAQDLVGKDVFVSDSLFNIRQAVNAMDVTNPNYYGQLMSATLVTRHLAEFKIHCDNRTFKYAYYDPYYELKCALKRGETIEHMYSNGTWHIATDPEFSDLPSWYRVKQEKPALKWQDLKIGDILRGPFMRYSSPEHDNDIYGVVTMIDTDSKTDRHIHVGQFWIVDEDISKFRRVDIRGVDIK